MWPILAQVAMQILAKKQQDKAAAKQQRVEINRERAGLTGGSRMDTSGKDPNAGLWAGLGALGGGPAKPGADPTQVAQQAEIGRAGVASATASPVPAGAFAAGVSTGAGSALQDVAKKFQQQQGAKEQSGGSGPLSSLAGDDEDIKNKLGQFGMSNIFG